MKNDMLMKKWDWTELVLLSLGIEIKWKKEEKVIFSVWAPIFLFGSATATSIAMYALLASYIFMLVVSEICSICYYYRFPFGLAKIHNVVYFLGTLYFSFVYKKPRCWLSLFSQTLLQRFQRVRLLLELIKSESKSLVTFRLIIMPGPHYKP